MDKIKKEKRIKKERLVKRSWWKIVLVISLILIILTSISVGLYFILVDDSSKYEEQAAEMNFTTDISDIQDDILDKEGREIAIFFYSEDDAISNYMFLDKIGDSEDGIGVITRYTNTHYSDEDRLWYAVEVDSDNSLAEDLLLNEEQNAFCDQFESLANGESANGDIPMYIDIANGSDEIASDSIKKSSVEGYKFSLNLNHDNDDNPSDIMLSIDESEPTQFIIQSGTTMWFNSDGSIETIIKSWGDVPADETVDTTWYENWIVLLSEAKD